MDELSNSIRHWPLQDQPRHKLSVLGEQALTDSELLAILLRTGANGKTAVDLARDILSLFGSFRKMSAATTGEWASIKGLGPAKIAQIKSAIEIGRRMQEESVNGAQMAVESSGDIGRLFMPRLRDLKIEVVKAVYLNSQNKIIAITDVEQGTVNAARPIIREIFREALERSASALICVHNHPSGNPEPSMEDRLFTEELEQAGAVLGIVVLDHIIIGDNIYYSFTDRKITE